MKKIAQIAMLLAATFCIAAGAVNAQQPPLALTPDPDLLTGLTFNDGVRDLQLQPNVANAVGLGRPGIYAVQAPPGLDSVTVTPTWTNTSITSVSGSVRHVTYGQDGSSVTWSSSESGVGKTVSLMSSRLPGNGTTLLTLSVTGVTSKPYRLYLQHNNLWKSANDRLRQLELEIGD